MNPVLKHQRNLVRTVRQLRLDRGVLLQQIEPGKAHIEISSGPTPAVIVIPERCRVRRCRTRSCAFLRDRPCRSGSHPTPGESPRRAAVHGRNAKRFVCAPQPPFPGGPRSSGRERCRHSPDARAHPGDDFDQRFALHRFVVIGRRVAPTAAGQEESEAGLGTAGSQEPRVAAVAAARWTRAAEPRARNSRRLNVEDISRPLSARTGCQRLHFRASRPRNRLGPPSELQRRPVSSGPHFPQLDDHDLGSTLLTLVGHREVMRTALCRQRHRGRGDRKLPTQRRRAALDGTSAVRIRDDGLIVVDAERFGGTRAVLWNEDEVAWADLDAPLMRYPASIESGNGAANVRSLVARDSRQRNRIREEDQQ